MVNCAGFFLKVAVATCVVGEAAKFQTSQFLSPKGTQFFESTIR
jgi:hypothetical protein